MIKRTLHLTYKAARRIVIAIVGSTVLLLGVIMIVTPGPAFILIPAGLAILALEFAWARHWLGKLRKKLSRSGAEQRAERIEKHRDTQGR